MSLKTIRGLATLRLITRRMLTPSQEFELWFWGDLRPRIHGDLDPTDRYFLRRMAGKSGERRIESIKNKLSK